MACFAAATSLRIHPHHAFFELSLVGIFVTRCAGKIGKVKRHSFGIECIRGFVAFIAGRGDVAAGQHKLRFFVARKGERGRPISIQGVTLIAGVEIGRAGKLRLMLVLVTIGAPDKFQLENRRAAGWGVALFALHADMFSL